jgi:integrase
MSHPSDSLDHLLNTRIQALALTLRPSTVRIYRHVSRRFLSYLHTHFPGLREVSDLHRDPHLLGWFAWLSKLHPPLGNKSRGDHLLGIRRLLHDLADQGHPVEAQLIRSADFPPPPRYLPRPLSPDEDRQLVTELRRIDDRDSNALLLLRATGIRVGECIDLPLDCLRDMGQQRWALQCTDRQTAHRTSGACG